MWHKFVNLVTNKDWFNPDWIEFESVIGSQAYGLATPESDTDLRGWYLPPAESTWALRPAPDQRDFTGEGRDAVYFELQKFLKLAYNGNPNILEILWSPKVTKMTPLAQDLQDIRSVFLSQKLRNTHMGYAHEQFTKMKNHPQWPWKHAMHLLRVLMAGISAYENGEIMVEVTGTYDREFLRRVRAGEVSQADFDEAHRDLLTRFGQAVRNSSLPPEPDYDTVNEFLIRARYHTINTNRD